ncbi:hypothetical protein BTUL_0240g00120 [Botrytis tulipae]|uniref:2EXR domain-containing protein n=1 Tax=Botrytis tulipae TaxID=87230 RepID=A0A4Z1EBD6_9HELO|nr:hypothetical protein BTUL_0240g00120 [Botrytis tulipae]
MCKDCHPLNPSEEGYQDKRDPRDGTFEKFTLLPKEVQCAIFKEALPSPQVIDLAFEITETRDHSARRIVRQLEISIPTNPSMLPLLKACATSNAEVYRNVQHIEITRLGTKTPFAISNPVMGVPPHIRNYEVVNRLKASMKPNTRAYTHMRADKDILMLDAANVFTLYSYGGTILMSNIKCLALQNASLDGMTWEIPGNVLGVNHELRRLHIFFKIISLHCPALSKVFFLLDGRNYFHFNEPPVQSQKLELRILNMDGDFFIQDFTGMGTKYKAEGAWEESARLSLQGDAKYVMRDWKDYRKAIVRNIARDGDVVNFWKTREPVIGLVGWFYADAQVDPSVFPLPRMYVPSLLAWLPAHADGTIVDRYKGLTQIFDSAPW